MLFYRDDGEVIQDARIAFNTNPGDVTQIRQIAIVEGSSTDLRTFPIANYIIEVEQPFWISGCDHVYLNPEFAYGTDMIEWIRGLAAGRSDVPIQFSMAHLDSLEGAIELSRTEVGRYTSGRPIWRRGALSCTPNQGGPRSTLSATLSDAIHAQLVVAELVSKVAMQLVRKQKGSRFFGKKIGDCTALAGNVLSRALGYFPGTTKEARDTNEHVIGDRTLGVEQLIFGKTSSYCFDDAINKAAGEGFAKLYGTSRKTLGQVLRSEMLDFTKRARSFDEQYDASALVAWSANTVLVLRIALAASLAFDTESDFYKTIFNEATTNKKRLDIARLDMIRQFKQMEGRRKGRRVKLGVEQLLDLQYATVIAFMANLDPTKLSLLLDYGIRSEIDPEDLLTPYLYLSAQWLGNLFRGRRLELRAHHAYALVGFANPDMLPEALPVEYREDWQTATRMMTSFMTVEGRLRLFEAAQSVLADNQSRTIYLRPLARLQPPKDPLEVAATAETMRKLRAMSNSIVQLPAPVFVEAGWLVLLGNYNQEWFGQCDPFEATDFPQ